MDCIDVFCDTMSSLVFLCDSSMTSFYHNKSLVQSSCLNAYSSSAPTKTLMTFYTTIVFNNVNVADMETIESQGVAIAGMEMSISSVAAEDITISNIVDNAASMARKYINPLSSSTKVTYKFSVILETLGYDQSSGSAAYTQLTSEIDTAVADGSLQKSLMVVGETVGIITFSSLTITTPAQSTIAVFTPLVTASPTPFPTSLQQSNGNSSNKENDTVPTMVFYILGAVVAIALVSLAALMITKSNQRREKSNPSIEIETRNTLTESNLRFESK